MAPRQKTLLAWSAATALIVAASLILAAPSPAPREPGALPPMILQLQGNNWLRLHKPGIGHWIRLDGIQAVTTAEDPGRGRFRTIIVVGGYQVRTNHEPEDIIRAIRQGALKLDKEDAPDATQK